MSIRLFNGLRWDATDIFELAPQVRDVISKNRRRLYMSVVAVTAVGDIQRRLRDGVELPQLGLLHYARQIDGPVSTAEGGLRRDLLDLSCTVVFQRHPNDPEHLYGQVYAEHDSFLQEVIAQTGATSFAFWTSTDRPDDVSDSEWEHRREMWSDMLDNFNRPPARSGVTVQVDHTDMDSWLPMLDDPELLAAVEAELAKLAVSSTPEPMPTAEQVVYGSLRTAKAS